MLRLASSARIGAALAAPYCSKHSRATLRSPGPAPDRTPEYLDGLPSNTIQQQLAVQESAIIHDRARILLSAVDHHAGLVILENPSTSMTWDDKMMYDWVRSIAPFAAQACACMFGKIGQSPGCLSPTARTSALTLLGLTSQWLASGFLMVPARAG
jgi:hypothetical protein